MQYELGFIGGGNMAEAIVRAAVQNRIVPPQRIIVSDPVEKRLALFELLGVKTTTDNAGVVASSRQVVLAVKPQTLPKLAGELSKLDAERQWIISIMAGIRCEKIETLAGKPTRIVRVMPNTPLLVGQGMSGVAMGPHARPGDEALALQLFSAAGKAVMVREDELDAVTAVSGSGPAYLFYLAEAMAEAAESLGLSPQQADRLSRQTLLGAAKLLAESTDAPAELRRKVTSPGGTTQAAVEHMESQQVKTHIIEAIRRAADRSRALGQ